MQTDHHQTTYPVLVHQEGRYFIAEAVDFLGHTVKRESLPLVLDAIKERIEEITWNTDTKNKDIPSPTPTADIPLSTKKTLVTVNTLTRYSNLPTTIYLYMPFGENLLEMIHEPYIWFSDPKQFNDPFELSDCIDTNFTAEEKYREFKYGLIREFNDANLSYSDTEIQTAFTRCQLTNPKVLEDAIESKKSLIMGALAKMKVACFSRHKDNVLMWSHYSKKHTGVVLSFPFSKFGDGKLQGGDIDYRWNKSKIRLGSYVGEAEKIFTNELITEALLTKHPCWAYEQEFRFLLPPIEGVENKIPLPKDSIQGVYFGLNMPPSIRETLRLAAGKRGIACYQMDKSENYGLIETPIPNV